MLKVPTADICINSPKQNEYVNFVSRQNQKCHILGRGGYGRVYKAIYKDQPVAVKIIEKVNEETIKSVSRESNILGWSHENIIKIFKVTPLDNCFTIIMERFQGICLQQLINEIKIPLWHRIRILIDVANGLSFCHSKNLVHLDVKPQNVFVAFGGSNNQKNDYKCKIFDFGCSTFKNEDSCRLNQHGTVRYMSPDILQGFNIGLHDDIYSFGITMWQLKSNTDPYFDIPSNEIVAYNVVKNNLRPDSQSKHFGINENENLEIMKSTTNNSLNTKCYSNKEILRLLTPNKRKALQPEFLSTGHRKKRILMSSSRSNKSIRKLDFNSVSENKNISIIKHKLCNNENDMLLNNKYIAAMFKYTVRHLSKEKKIEMEHSYESIYKQCWEQEAIKRPSSQDVLDLLHSILYLFD